MKYYFKKTDSGIVGKAFEMAIKKALNLPNADEVSPAGKPDFRYNRKCYDCKQNGTVVKYDQHTGYIFGSSRVIYATHVAHTLTIDGDIATIEIDLGNTEMFVVDRNAFVDFLLTNGLTKGNVSRGTVNIQTGYNYTKDAYHGRTGRKIEAWCYDNDIGDDIIGEILANI